MAADGLKAVPSSFGPKETMDRLEAQIRAQGMTVFARIDHAAGAAAVAMPLRPTELLIFGSAKAGTPLMQADQKVGIDLPLKALVYEDAAGRVWLAYQRSALDRPPARPRSGPSTRTWMRWRRRWRASRERPRDRRDVDRALRRKTCLKQSNPKSDSITGERAWIVAPSLACWRLRAQRARLVRRAADAQPAPKIRNVVLVHGLFADGSCWSEVIPRLQAAGLNATSVQNPLTTLDESVAAAQRALALQDGPTVLVGHSFSGMIVTEAGVDPKVTALVYVAARAPDAGEDYTELAKRFPAAAGVGRHSLVRRLGAPQRAGLSPRLLGRPPEGEGAGALRVQGPFQRRLLEGRTTHAAWRSKPS